MRSRILVFQARHDHPDLHFARRSHLADWHERLRITRGNGWVCGVTLLCWESCGEVGESCWCGLRGAHHARDFFVDLRALLLLSRPQSVTQDLIPDTQRGVR